MQILKNKMCLNAAAIYGGEALCRSTTFAAALIVARRFSPAALGQYGYALAIASVFVLLPDMGIHLLATREMAADRRALPDAFWNLHWLKLILVGFVSAAGLLIGIWAIHDSGRRWLFYILALRALLQSFSLGCMAVFKALERMHFVALLQLTNGIVTVAGLALCVLLKAGLYVTVSALLGGQASEVLLGWWIIYRYFNPGPVRPWDTRSLSIMFLAAAPIGITSILQAFGLRLDVLILGVYSANEELGQFQAAAWMVVASFLVTSLLMTVLFPKLVRLLRNKTPAGSAYLESLLKHGTLAATFASIIVWIAAPDLVQLFFGRPLSPATSFLRMLAPVLPFVFMNTTMFFVFIAINRRRAYLATLACTVGLSVLLSLRLAPRLGGVGVALADLIREVAGSVIFLYLLHRESRVPSLGPALLKVIVGSATFALVAVLLVGIGGNLHLWAVAWSLVMLGGILLLAGTPSREQVFLLASEDL